jgi:hypothetical protein
MNEVAIVVKSTTYMTVETPTIVFVLKTIITGFRRRPGLTPKPPAISPQDKAMITHFIVLEEVHSKSPYEN